MHDDERGAFAYADHLMGDVLIGAIINWFVYICSAVNK